MKHFVTILIPTHNRHHYLSRILDYYKEEHIQIIIADSTEKSFTGEAIKDPNIQYLHLPQRTLPAKLEWSLNQVKTTFVVMCADDDFTIPGAIYKCIDFLQKNKGFGCAQGNCISYKKNQAAEGLYEYSILYKDLLSFQINDEDPFKRLEVLLKNYRTLFTGVHYTDNLCKAFNGAGELVKNLFLNEYLTAIIPIVAGKYAEIAMLYQVREYAEGSDDKITDNLNKFLVEDKYKEELNKYIDSAATKVSTLTSVPNAMARARLVSILEDFADTFNIVPLTTGKKKLGKEIERIPVVGKKLIALNRKLEKERDLKKVVKTNADKENLQIIERFIKKHSSNTFK